MSGEPDREREAIVTAGRAALADIRRASEEATAAVVRVIAAETGVYLGPPAGPSVMDAQWGDLDRLAGRCTALLELHALIKQRRLPGDTRTLGTLVRELPEDVRESVADLCIRAGLS